MTASNSYLSERYKKKPRQLEQGRKKSPFICTNRLSFSYVQIVGTSSRHYHLSKNLTFAFGKVKFIWKKENMQATSIFYCLQNVFEKELFLRVVQSQKLFRKELSPITNIVDQDQPANNVQFEL